MSGTTIVALSSGSLPSGVAVVRLSGPQTPAIVGALAGPLPRPRTLALRSLVHPATGKQLDRALIAVFPAPASFTGEDCAELHLHGSPATVRAVLDVCTRNGAALAGAGDFTRRAFENGKLDLTAVEGLGDLLAAETEAQRLQALSRLEGTLARHITHWRTALLDLRAQIEAHLDFSEEDDVPEGLGSAFEADVEALRANIQTVLEGYHRGRLTREGFRIVLVGAPNAGKSTLLNALAGSDLAIVTQEAGTTRDTKDVTIDIAGRLVVITDTAGLRDTDSLAEAEGVRRARAAMESADLVLWLLAPDTENANSQIPDSTPHWRIATKSDIERSAPNVDLSISVHRGTGLSDLISRIETHMDSLTQGHEPALISHLRDRDALAQAVEYLEDAQAPAAQPELRAESLRLASDSLARLVGLMDNEAVLDRLFAEFCIGK